MIKLINLTSQRQVLRSLSSKVQRKLKEQVERTGRMTEADAVAAVPVDTGALRNSITYESTNEGLGFRISANEPYAAFVEFGTGGSVAIPRGWATVAAPFKGKGGRTFSMPARPYLLPAFTKNVALLRRRLNNLFK